MTIKLILMENIVNTKVYYKLREYYLMKEFFGEIWGTVKAIIIASSSIAIAVIVLVLICVGTIFATLYWPFYSYEHQNSFVSETQKIYPFDVRFGSDSAKKSEMDNYFLMAGKMYCGAKLVNQHVALKNYVSQSTKSADDKKQLDILYENADKFLCSKGTQLTASK
jgi:hypothetical protein